MNRNPDFAKLTPSYLFQEVTNRVKEFKKLHPEAKPISLAIGDTTLPIVPVIAEAMEKKARDLKNKKTYSGYGDEQGQIPLREKIASTFYNNQISPDDIFISDGAKCDLGRLQILFGKGRRIALQDPAYPVYHDTSLAMGCASLTLLPTLPENGFFPSLDKAEKADILFFSSPNNPTGMALTRDHLETLVAFAQKHSIIIVYDAAYNLYISDPSFPKSIYEIPGSEKVAIEVGSFSKLAGFTGVRLGWSVVPSTLRYSDGGQIRNDWKRIHSTFFNGASNIAQAGGIAALSKEGLHGIYESISYYKENATLLSQALKQHEVFGGEHAPFLWVRFKDSQKSSWALFDHFLNNYHIVTTPGSGFGSSGEGFLRFSSLGHREEILQATSLLKSQKDLANLK